MNLEHVQEIRMTENEITIIYEDHTRNHFKMNEENLQQLFLYLQQQYQLHNKNINDVWLNMVGLNTMTTSLLIGGTMISYAISDLFVLFTALGITGVIEFIRKIHTTLYIRGEYKKMDEIKEETKEVKKLLLKKKNYNSKINQIKC